MGCGNENAQMSGMTREGRIKNKYVRGIRIVDNIKKNKLRWFGHVSRWKQYKRL